MLPPTCSPIYPPIPFFMPSPMQYATPPPDCVPLQYSQYCPLPSEMTRGKLPSANSMHNWIPSPSVPQFPLPPYHPPGINYQFPQGLTTGFNSCADRQTPPQEFFNTTKWPHVTPVYPVPKLPTNGIDANRYVNSRCPQTLLSSPTYSFVPLASNTNNCSFTNIPYLITNGYDQSPILKTTTPSECCNGNCAPDSDIDIVSEPTFSPGHHSSVSFDLAAANLYAQSSYSVPVSPQPQYYSSMPTCNSGMQLSVYDLKVLLLSPPPPPPPVLPPPLPLSPPSSYTDKNVHTLSQQFSPPLDGSSVPKDITMDQKTSPTDDSHVPIDMSINQKTSSHNCLPQQSSFLLPQQPILPLSCINMNELVLPRVLSFPYNLHILHPPLKSKWNMPGVRDQLLSFSTPQSLGPILNMDEHAQIHRFDQRYFPSLQFPQLSMQFHNPLSVMTEQTLQETSIIPYSGWNYVPYQSPSPEHVPHILNIDNTDIHTLAHQVSCDINSGFQSPSQEPPLDHLPSTDDTDEETPTSRDLMDHNSRSLPISSQLVSSVVAMNSSEPIECQPTLGNTDEEISSPKGLFEQNSAFPPTSSQLTSTMVTIHCTDGQETLEITTYDLYLLLLPPPPPPPYPPPSPPPTHPPATESSSEPSLLTTDVNSSEDQLLSPSCATISEDQLESQSSSTCSEDQLESQSSSFEVQVLDYSPLTEQPILPFAEINNERREDILPSTPNNIPLPLELTSPIQAMSSMEECTPQQTFQIDSNSYSIPPSMIPIPQEPYMPPAINPNKNTPIQMPLYCTRPHPTQLFSSTEQLPNSDNSQSNDYPAPQVSKDLIPPHSMVPLAEPKLPMLVVNTPDGLLLFWKPFRLPPPPLGPSAIAPFNITGNCVLPPFNMNRLCTPPRFTKPLPPFNMNRLCSPPRFSKPMPPFNLNRSCTSPSFSKPMLVGNMPTGLAAHNVPPFVPKLMCVKSTSCHSHQTHSFTGHSSCVSF